MRNGDEIEYPAILAQMDKGEDVDIVEAVNAQRWRMNNQRREIAKLHAKAEALTHQRDNLAKALRDFQEHGLRFDLNPTHDLRYASTPEGQAAATFWHSYIQDMDKTVRQRATNALHSCGLNGGMT